MFEFEDINRSLNLNTSWSNLIDQFCNLPESLILIPFQLCPQIVKQRKAIIRKGLIHTKAKNIALIALPIFESIYKLSIISYCNIHFNNIWDTNSTPIESRLKPHHTERLEFGPILQTTCILEYPENSFRPRSCLQLPQYIFDMNPAENLQ